MRVEGRGRAHVPAVDLEAEPAQELGHEVDAGPRLGGEVRRLLRLALGPERDEPAHELDEPVAALLDGVGPGHALESASGSSAGSSTAKRTLRPSPAKTWPRGGSKT